MNSAKTDALRARLSSTWLRGPPFWPVAALTAAMAISTTLLLWEGRHQTFFNDEWDLILHRRGQDIDTLLHPEHGHLVLVPLLIYKLLLQVFGTGSYAPYRVTAIVLGLVCVGLLFVLVRRRVGPDLAVAAAVLMLFLGSAWEQLLWPLGITYYCGIAAGLGMLVAFDRGDRRGDIAACALLALALASFSIGLAFAVAAIAEIMAATRPRPWRRLWVAGIPIALYGLWSLGYGESEFITTNIASTPFFVADSAAGVAASLTGLFRVPGTAAGAITGFPAFTIEWGRPIAVLAAIAVLARLARPESASPRLWTLVALVLAFWVSAALVAGIGRSPGASRYQYPGALFALLIAAEMLQGVRFTTTARLLLAGGLAFALVANLANLYHGAQFLSGQAEVNRAELAGLELAKGRVAPGFSPEGLGSYPPAAGRYLQFVDAGAYFSLIERYGSPADPLTKLNRRSEPARQAADIVLARALRLTMAPATRERAAGAPPRRTVQASPAAGAPGQPAVQASPAPVASKGACLELPRGPAKRSLAAVVPANGLILRSGAGPPGMVFLGRFGNGFAFVLGLLRGNSVTRVMPPPDAAGRPWRVLVVTGGGSVSACRRG